MCSQLSDENVKTEFLFKFFLSVGYRKRPNGIFSQTFVIAGLSRFHGTVVIFKYYLLVKCQDFRQVKIYNLI